MDTSHASARDHRESARPAANALVSVIMAARNAERYIERTCRSVLAQSHQSLELIVVDDGSTDRTGALLRQIAATDARVRLIEQGNCGVAAARNRAIAAAAGEFIAPVDADDVWAPGKIEQQVRRFDDGASDLGMVYCWWVWIDSEDRVLDRSPRWELEGRCVEELLEVNFTGNASVPLYRRACLDEVGGYRTDLRARGRQGCEDWDLAIRVAERYAVGVAPAILVGYRRRQDSMSADYEAMWLSQSEVIASAAARQDGMPADVLRRAHGQFALHLAGVAFWSGDYLGACRWTLKARPATLILSVMPHVARLLTRRVLRLDAARTPLSAVDGRFDDAAAPRPLIPYDRIYTRHWRRHHRP